MRYIFFVLLFLFHFNSACALAIKQTWTEEVHLEKNEIPYSISSIQFSSVVV